MAYSSPALLTASMWNLFHCMFITSCSVTLFSLSVFPEVRKTIEVCVCWGGGVQRFCPRVYVQYIIIARHCTCKKCINNSFSPFSSSEIHTLQICV